LLKGQNYLISLWALCEALDGNRIANTGKILVPREVLAVLALPD
jgi:hypothetical protein